jgi:rhamnosyltransferase
MSAPRVSIILPTWNGERDLERLLPALAKQEIEGGFEIRAIDSGSTDGSCALLERAGAHLERIPHAEFRHGPTRNRAANGARGDVLVFLSQDAEPRDANFLAALASAFDDPKVAGAYARILPREGDDPLTARTVLSAREAGETAETRRLPSGTKLVDLDPGERARLSTFNDVASAIRASVFRSIPFPDVAFGEDVAWAARALEANLSLRFEPRAVVLHAHRYTPSRAYERYKVDATFHREHFGDRVRPSLFSVARGIAHEVREDLRHVVRHGGALHLLRSPFLRTAQVLGQYAGSRGGN